MTTEEKKAVREALEQGSRLKELFNDFLSDDGSCTCGADGNTHDWIECYQHDGAEATRKLNNALAILDKSEGVDTDLLDEIGTCDECGFTSFKSMTHKGGCSKNGNFIVGQVPKGAGNE